MKQQQTASEKRVSFFLCLAILPAQLQGASPKTATDTSLAGASNSRKNRKTANTSGGHAFSKANLATIPINFTRNHQIIDASDSRESTEIGDASAAPSSIRHHDVLAASHFGKKWQEFHKSGHNGPTRAGATSSRLPSTADTSNIHKLATQQIQTSLQILRRIGPARAATNSSRPRTIDAASALKEIPSGNHTSGETGHASEDSWLRRVRRAADISRKRENEPRKTEVASGQEKTLRFRGGTGSSGGRKSSSIAVRSAFAKLASAAQIAHSTQDSQSVHGAETTQSSHSSRNPVLIQRSSARLRRKEPRNVEEIPLIWGVPKMVWVILFDVVAMGIFLLCTVCVAWADRAVQEKGWANQGPYQPDPLLAAPARSLFLTPTVGSQGRTPSFGHIAANRNAGLQGPQHTHIASPQV